MYCRDGNGFSHMGDGWQWLLMGVFWIVLILLAVLAVVVLIRALQPRHSVPGVPVPDALALLDVRLARGRSTSRPTTSSAHDWSRRAQVCERSC
jgi:uncharacterized membrane protein